MKTSLLQRAASLRAQIERLERRLAVVCRREGIDAAVLPEILRRQKKLRR